MKTILIYFAWLFIISFLPSLISWIIFYPFSKFLKKGKFSQYGIILLSTIISVLVTVTILIYLTYYLKSAPTYLMFLLSWIFISSNDYRRIALTRNGKTNVAKMVGDEYDSKKQLKFEYLYLVGDFIGIWLPLLFLQKISFI